MFYLQNSVHAVYPAYLALITKTDHRCIIVFFIKRVHHSHKIDSNRKQAPKMSDNSARTINSFVGEFPDQVDRPPIANVTVICHSLYVFINLYITFDFKFKWLNNFTERD